MKKEGLDPLALRRRVILKKGLQKYKDAFRDISAQRMFGEQGPQSIQLEALESYLDIIGEGREEYRKLYLRLVLDMDTIFMEHIRKKLERK